jgi:apolipoprotein N-acyltransferase
MPEAGRLRRFARLIEQRRRWLVLAGFTLGFFAAMGQAPFGFYPATLAGLIGGFALLHAAPTLARAALTGWGFGFGYFALGLVWIVQPFLVDPWRHGWMAPFALLLMSGGMALFWAAGFWAARWLAPRSLLWLGWPAAMAAAELLRGAVFTGFPWGGVAMAWINTPVVHLAAHVGAVGLGFLTFLLCSAAHAALNGRRKLLGLGSLAAAGAVALLLGGQRTGGAVDYPADPVIVRLVQPNAPQHLKWDPEFALRFLNRQLDLTALASDPVVGAPDLVVWPETAVPYLLERAGPVLDEIAMLADATVIVGIQRREDGRYFNSAVALDPGGTVVATYDKHHLVPFGEYIPGGNLLHRLGIKGFASQQGYGYSAGPGAAVLDLGRLGKVLPLICYEAIFARDLRAAPERPDWILQLTNDAWYGTFSGPQQHLVQARMRAVEMGLPLVRVANTGISAVIDARGRLTAAIGLDRAGARDAPIPSALPATLYWRLGDAPLVLTLIAIGAGLFLGRRRNSIDPARRPG